MNEAVRVEWLAQIHSETRPILVPNFVRVNERHWTSDPQDFLIIETTLRNWNYHAKEIAKRCCVKREYEIT
jgi:hypothetical protein